MNYQISKWKSFFPRRFSCPTFQERIASLNQYWLLLLYVFKAQYVLPPQHHFHANVHTGLSQTWEIVQIPPWKPLETCDLGKQTGISHPRSPATSCWRHVFEGAGWPWSETIQFWGWTLHEASGFILLGCYCCWCCCCCCLCVCGVSEPQTFGAVRSLIRKPTSLKHRFNLGPKLFQQLQLKLKFLVVQKVEGWCFHESLNS